MSEKEINISEQPIFKCPHCKEYIIISKINCGIFRHGTYKKNYIQIDPHDTKDICKWFFNQVSSGSVNIIKPELLGAKKSDDSPVILDDLMSDTNMELSKESFGLYIQADELIKRRHFGWFVRMSPAQVLQSNTQIAKYLLAMN